MTKAKTKPAEQKTSQDGSFILAIHQHLFNLVNSATGAAYSPLEAEHLARVKLDDLFTPPQWAEFRIAYETLFGLEIRKRLLKTKRPRFCDIFEYTLTNVDNLPILAAAPSPREMVTAKPTAQEVIDVFFHHNTKMQAAMRKHGPRDQEGWQAALDKAQEELRQALKGLNGLDAHIDWL